MKGIILARGSDKASRSDKGHSASLLHLLACDLS